MGPGFRRESDPVAVSSRAGRQRRWGTNKKQVGWRRQVILNTSPAKAGVHLSVARARDRWVPAFERVIQLAFSVSGCRKCAIALVCIRNLSGNSVPEYLSQIGICYRKLSDADENSPPFSDMPIGLHPLSPGK